MVSSCLGLLAMYHCLCEFKCICLHQHILVIKKKKVTALSSDAEFLTTGIKCQNENKSLCSSLFLHTSLRWSDVVKAGQYASSGWTKLSMKGKGCERGGGKREITALRGEMVEWWSYVSKYSALLSCLIKHFHINLFAVSITRFTVYRKSGWKCQTFLTYLTRFTKKLFGGVLCEFPQSRGGRN